LTFNAPVRLGTVKEVEVADFVLKPKG